MRVQLPLATEDTTYMYTLREERKPRVNVTHRLQIITKRCLEKVMGSYPSMDVRIVSQP